MKTRLTGMGAVMLIVALAGSAEARGPKARIDLTATAAGARGRASVALKTATDGKFEVKVQKLAGDTDFDIRGDFLNDDRPCTQFMTINTPNAGTDVTPYCLNNGINPPCTTSGSGNAYKSARSKHTGGVNTLFGDGSIRFVRNVVLPATWRAYGTMNGGEVVNDN